MEVSAAERDLYESAVRYGLNRLKQAMGQAAGLASFQFLLDVSKRDSGSEQVTLLAQLLKEVGTVVTLLEQCSAPVSDDTLQRIVDALLSAYEANENMLLWKWAQLARNECHGEAKELHHARAWLYDTFFLPLTGAEALRLSVEDEDFIEHLMANPDVRIVPCSAAVINEGGYSRRSDWKDVLEGELTRTCRSLKPLEIDSLKRLCDEARERSEVHGAVHPELALWLHLEANDNAGLSNQAFTSREIASSAGTCYPCQMIMQSHGDANGSAVSPGWWMHDFEYWDTSPWSMPEGLDTTSVEILKHAILSRLFLDIYC